MKLANKKSSSDTVLMHPISQTISSIVIIAKNTKWVEDILKDVVKNKSKNYQQKEMALDYSFNLKSLSDSSGYAFESSGKIISPVYSVKEGFKICPTLNIVKYKDVSTGTDFMQLRRSVYEDFIHDFDNGFIKKHRFTQTSYIDEENENIVQKCGLYSVLCFEPGGRHQLLLQKPGLKADLEIRNLGRPRHG